MKIGDEVFVHGYVDEIRKDCIIIRNDGGYFGIVEDEIISIEIKSWNKDFTEPYVVIDTPQTERRTDRDGDVWEWRGDAWYCIGQADTPKTKRSIEADKVVEALKICDHNSDGESCKTCTYRDAKWDGAWESEDGEWCCYKQLASDAISLIEQTERSSE